MGRSPRILIEGGAYHVSNRVSRGELSFRNEAEAERLFRRLLETKHRDGFQVLTWCLMSNHSHLTLRMDEVARGLEKYMETAGRLVSRAAARRVEDEGLSAVVKAVDAAVIDSFGER